MKITPTFALAAFAVAVLSTGSIFAGSDDVRMTQRSAKRTTVAVVHNGHGLGTVQTTTVVEERQIEPVARHVSTGQGTVTYIAAAE